MQNPEFLECKNCGEKIFEINIRTEEDPIIHGHFEKDGCTNPEPQEKREEHGSSHR